MDKMALDSFLYHCLGFTPLTALPFFIYLLREGSTVTIFGALFPGDIIAISQKIINKNVVFHIVQIKRKIRIYRRP